ncbi:GNAT family N-acetyltransferase [Planctomycetes bacterium Poly30]
MPRSVETSVPSGYRSEPAPADIVAVRDVVTSSGFFSPAEIEVAVELVEERLAKGLASGYHFLFADGKEGARGYTCFGEVPATVGSYDLYWIAVHESERGSGIGRSLLAATEAEIDGLGGARIWVETSSRDLYVPTRAFYLACGYTEAARLPDFYGKGDAKVVFVKALSGPESGWHSESAPEPERHRDR